MSVGRGDYRETLAEIRLFFFSLPEGFVVAVRYYS